MRLALIASSTLTLVGLAKAIDHFPFPCHETYQVSEGDTCKSIAATAGTDASILQLWQQDFHDKFECSSLTPGQLLCVDYSTSIVKRDIREAPGHGSPHVDVAVKKGKKPHHKKGKKPHSKKPATPSAPHAKRAAPGPAPRPVTPHPAGQHPKKAHPPKKGLKAPKVPKNLSSPTKA